MDGAGYTDSNGTGGCKVYTVIDGYSVKTRTVCPVTGTRRATYERDHESTTPMIRFAEAARALAQDDHKEEHTA